MTLQEFAKIAARKRGKPSIKKGALIGAGIGGGLGALTSLRYGAGLGGLAGGGLVGAGVGSGVQGIRRLLRKKRNM